MKNLEVESPHSGSILPTNYVGKDKSLPTKARHFRTTNLFFFSCRLLAAHRHQDVDEARVASKFDGCYGIVEFQNELIAIK